MNLSLNNTNNTVLKDGTEKQLTSKEFGICVHICHIREKLESSHSEKILDSFWRRGYRFNSAS